MSVLTEIEKEIKGDLEGFEKRLSKVFESHLKSAENEGSALEPRIIALVKELIMTTASDLQSKINTLSSKFSQVEADVGALVSKSGGSAAASSPSGGLVTQDQLDAMGTAVDGLASRADALVALVVNGNAPASASSSSTPSSGSAPSAPSDPSTPPSTTPVTTTPPVNPSAPTTAGSSSSSAAPATPPAS